MPMLQKITITSFLADSATKTYSKVRDTFRKKEMITLDDDDAKTFVEAITKPVEFNKELRNALKNHDRKVVSE